jgi:TonB family protein
MSPSKSIRIAAVSSMVLGLAAASLGAAQSPSDSVLALVPATDPVKVLLPHGKLDDIAAVTAREIAPRVVRHVLPVYPENARQARLQGIVSARVLVDARGKVARVGRLRGQAIFHEAVRTAVQQWEFTPASQGDRPVSTWLTLSFSFEL